MLCLRGNPSAGLPDASHAKPASRSPAAGPAGVAAFHRRLEVGHVPAWVADSFKAISALGPRTAPVAAAWVPVQANLQKVRNVSSRPYVKWAGGGPLPRSGKNAIKRGLMAQVMAASGDAPWESPYFQKMYSINRVEFENNTSVAGPPVVEFAISLTRRRQ